MAYTIKTWDKLEIVVDNEAGEKIKELLNTDVQFIGINGSMYAKSAIAQITKGGQLPVDESRQVKAGEAVDNRGTVSPERLAEFRRKAFGVKA